MNAKHYVSLEVAKMLKEKGYNEETQYLQVDSALHKGLCINYLKPELCGGMKVDDTTAFPAPSLLEAMDRLEERGVHIEIRMMHCKVKGDPYKIADDDEYQWKWYFVIYKDDDVKHPIVEEGEDGYVVMHSDKNECMNAAVKKGAELL